MRYTIEFRPAAARDFRKLSADVRPRLAKKIDALATTPRPNGAKKLAGETELYRVRVGDYRIIYQVEDARLVVLVVRVGHRRDAYR